MYYVIYLTMQTGLTPSPPHNASKQCLHIIPIFAGLTELNCFKYMSTLGSGKELDEQHLMHYDIHVV